MSLERFSSLSDFLLHLYSNSEEASPSMFTARMLMNVCETIQADKAWWGILAVDGDQFELRCSARRELPTSFEPMWESIKGDDGLARCVAHAPRRTIYFDDERFRRYPGLTALTTEHEIHHALCTAVYLPDSESFMFLSLYRQDASHAFSIEDSAIKQLLMPHLFAAWNQNLRASLRKRLMGYQRPTCFAFADLQGELIQYDEEFAALLGRQWPHWHPPTLPPVLRSMLNEHRPGSSSRLTVGRLALRIADAGPLRLLELHAATDIDRLSPREMEVVAQFAGGASYKEIAKIAGLTPATVRHYVRSAYAKLGVNDKGELATLYASCTGVTVQDTSRLIA
ncbi:helix-turn-helix transcriptional regulator [Burkholderia pseudomallei]|uniref:helix-turn-helix transcriptional regulator n=1 Tax=Burkholderia pseudomallei TaxID=28450 RepID=UPI00052AFD71|nr:helix-turn-helix transcriptional regulator [Burkholderia pseudomallei]AIV63224.1 bacterial regulatory s, luxR family protein [Burkholderia pseudomallei K42]